MSEAPTEKTPVNVDSANQRLADVFAPWVQQLKLSIEVVEEDRVVIRMPYSDDLCRSHQMICGQAMMTLIDTCMVFVCYVGQGKYSNCTTVSQNTSFMRPVMGVDILATGRVLKSGRSLVYGEVTLRSEGDDRIVCAGTSTYMMLPD
jgi:uncharacterized protein (TIGR00369 family)